MKENFTIIALGSNLGDRLGNLKLGLQLLKEQIKLADISHIYASKAQLMPSAPKEWDMEYYNCVFYGNTLLDPASLLEFCNKVEDDISKKEKGTWAPRKLDVDILAYNNDIIDTEKLKIPHRLMHQRAFVTLPLSEILPEWQHPLLKNTAKELANINNGQVLTKLEFKL